MPVLDRTISYSDIAKVFGFVIIVVTAFLTEQYDRQEADAIPDARITALEKVVDKQEDFQDETIKTLNEIAKNVAVSEERTKNVGRSVMPVPQPTGN